MWPPESDRPKAVFPGWVWQTGLQWYRFCRYLRWLRSDWSRLRGYLQGQRFFFTAVQRFRVHRSKVQSLTNSYFGFQIESHINLEIDYMHSIYLRGRGVFFVKLWIKRNELLFHRKSASGGSERIRDRYEKTSLSSYSHQADGYRWPPKPLTDPLLVFSLRCLCASLYPLEVNW